MYFIPIIYLIICNSRNAQQEYIVLYIYLDHIGPDLLNRTIYQSKLTGVNHSKSPCMVHLNALLPFILPSATISLSMPFLTLTCMSLVNPDSSFFNAKRMFALEHAVSKSGR